MENVSDLGVLQRFFCYLRREGIRESSRSITTDDHLIQEERQLTNRVDGTINHDGQGITGGSSAQLGYADKVTVVSGEAVQSNDSDAASTVEERSRRIDGGVMVVKDNDSRQVSTSLEGGLIAHRWSILVILLRLWSEG